MVTDAGMGPLELGVPYADAFAAVPGAEDACGFASSAFDSQLWLAGWPTDPSEPAGSASPLGVVTWGQGASELTDGPRTPEGIGLGSTVAEVRATYPDVVEVYRQGLNLRTGNVFFEIDETAGAVRAVGVTNDDVPYEFCG